MVHSLPGFGSLPRRVAACLGVFFVLLPLLFASAAMAQDAAGDEVVVFVLDLSGSMNEPFDGQNTKLDVAKAAFVEAFTNLSSDARVGLRTYGDTIAATAPELREPSCTTDTRVVAPVAAAQRDLLVSQVQGFTALGDTPMGLALQQAATDIPAGATGTIVLFSDGRDECFDADLDGDPAIGPSFGQDPCEIARTITNDNPAVERVVTVGFRADAAAEIELRCIAESTGGSYTAIETPEDARDALPELLVQLSAPREAQRQVGRAIQGGTSTETAADLVRLDELGADAALYTDSIAMNSKRFYRLDEYGPEGGTLTATVFGLPAELGIELDMRIFVPQLDERFFQGKHGDFDAGLPARPTASIRCTDCRITGGPYEVYFVVTLDSPEVDVEGTYELEILTEGPGFGGPPTSCSAPQACFYPQEIADLTAELEVLQAELDADIGDIAPAPMIAERDELRSQQQEAEQAIGAATTRAEALEARLPLAPGKSNSFRIPLLLIVLGAVLGFAPLRKLKRSRDSDSDDADDDDDAVVAGSDVSSVSAPTSTGPIVTPLEPDLSAGQPLEVGPPPAINQTLGSPGNNWDAELEAAKAALAQQRPLRPNGPDGGPGPGSEIGVSELPASSAPSSPAVASAPSIHGQFTPAQHAAAKAAAEKIAAQHAAEAAAAQQTTDTPAPTFAPPPGPALATPVPATFEADDHQPAVQATALPPAAEPDPEIAAAEQAAREAAEREAAEKAAAEQVTEEAAAERAADRAAAERTAAERAAREAAERAAAEQAAREAAAREAAASEAAERAAAEKAAREAAEQAAAEKAAAEKAAAEQAAREAAEQAAAARAAAEQAAAEQAAREAAEQAAAEKAAAEKAAREAAEQAAAKKAAAEKAAREAAEQAAAEKAAAEKAAAEQAAREAAEQAAAARAAAEQAAAEKAAAEQAAREAAERAAAEQAAAARAAAEKAAAEKAAAEQAAREAAERAAAARAAAEQAAAEQAAREAAERAAAEKAAAEQAAREAAERAAREAAEQAAADRAAAEKAAAEQAAAEQAAREASERAAADRAAAEKASADRVAAEEAARQASAERIAAEEAAAQAKAQRETAEAAALQAEAQLAAEEAAAQAAAQAASASPTANSAQTEEERRQEARRRMLAKQNIVASSSGSGITSSASVDTAGTSAALRPMTVHPASDSPAPPVQNSTPDAPGWYEDQAIVGQFRWWDGSTWTGYTSPDDQGPAPS